MTSEEPTCVICFKSECTFGKLSCSHEFCTDCIEKINVGNNISCPLCRSVTASTIFSNSQLLDNSLKCDKCIRENAIIGCRTCMANLCYLCWNSVHSFGNLLFHKKTTVVKIWIDTKCHIPDHSMFDANIYCSSHKTTICCMCFEHEHRSCKIESIRSYNQTKRSEAEEQLTFIRSKINLLSDQIKKYKSFIKIKALNDQIEKKITEYHDQLVSIKEQLLHKAEAYYADVQDHINQIETVLNKYKADEALILEELNNMGDHLPITVDIKINNDDPEIQLENKLHIKFKPLDMDSLIAVDTYKYCQGTNSYILNENLVS